MSDLFLSPHNLGDDECLFGAYTILRQRPFVAICFRSAKQAGLGITYQKREAETANALAELGEPDWAQNDLLDTTPDEAAAEILWEFFADLDALEGEWDHVYAPAVEDGGHEQHNLVGVEALERYGNAVRPYLTYRRGWTRSRNGHDVPLRTPGREVVPEPGYVAAKMRALACYESQIDLAATRPWFMDNTLREYMP